MAVPELNLLDYWRVIRKRKITIILIVVICASIAFIHAYRQPPIYTATARIMIEEPRNVATGNIQQDLFLYSEADFINTQSLLIQSKRVAEDAAKVVGWIKEEMSKSKRDEIISEIQGSISTKREEQTNLVDIIATTGDSDKAVLIANAVAKGFERFSLEERASQARKTREFIGQQLQEVEKRLEKKEEELKDFRKESERSGSIDSMRSQLIQWEAELDGLLEKYTELHPDVKEKRRQLAGLRSRLDKYPEEEMRLKQLERNIETDKNLYGVLKQRYEESRITEADTTSGVTIVSEAAYSATILPKKFINTTLGGLLGLFLGLVIAFVKENLDTSIGTIEGIESFLELPVLGVIPQIIPEGEVARKVSWIDMLWPRQYEKSRREEVRDLLNLEADIHSTSAEAYKTLRTNLDFTCKQNNLKVLAFTSSGSQEGKTLTTANCAIALAQNGQRVLLISADLRRGFIYHIFGLNKEPGLFDILTRNTDPNQVIRGFTDLLLGQLSSEKLMKTSGIDNLSILTSGHTPPNPAELLGSKAMAGFIEQMRSKYDYVLLDCPPVLPVADALLLSPKVDGVILVYHSGKTARGALKRAKAQLLTVNANIIGVILNNIKAAELKMGPSYYYYGYGGYYEEEEVAKKRKERRKRRGRGKSKNDNEVDQIPPLKTT